MALNRDNIELSLREHLIQAQQSHPPSSTSGPPAQHSPHDQHIDPAIATSASYQMSAGDSGGDDTMQDSRKGRRELSTSKRAAQNRAAQRAFRQRKEEYIKSLRDQVKEFEVLNENYKAVQAENYQLRDYIINLQSRLIESQGTYPEPPVEINLTRSANASTSEPPAMSSSAVNQLVSAAKATESREGGGVSVKVDDSLGDKLLAPAPYEIQDAAMSATEKAAGASEPVRKEGATNAVGTSAGEEWIDVDEKNAVGTEANCGNDTANSKKANRKPTRVYKTAQPTDNEIPLTDNKIAKRLSSDYVDVDYFLNPNLVSDAESSDRKPLLKGMAKNTGAAAAAAYDYAVISERANKLPRTKSDFGRAYFEPRAPHESYSEAEQDDDKLDEGAMERMSRKTVLTRPAPVSQAAEEPTATVEKHEPWHTDSRPKSDGFQPSNDRFGSPTSSEKAEEEDTSSDSSDGLVLAISRKKEKKNKRT